MLTYTAFEEFNMLFQGTLEEVALTVRKRLKQDPLAKILIFSDSSGKQMDLDLSGTEKETLERLKVFLSPETSHNTGPGRPKLGVISREVSLLPKHWEWLSNQTGGSSGAIRRLIDEKLKSPQNGRDLVKQSQEITYKFLTALAGNLPNFEEAIRYLYRRDKRRFRELISDWPRDVVSHTMLLTKTVFAQETK
jgi:uncharacterized protein